MFGLASTSGCGIGHVHSRAEGANVQKLVQSSLLIVRVVLLRSKKRCPSQINSFLLSCSIAFINAVPLRTTGTYPLMRAALKVLRSARAVVLSPFLADASARIRYISPVRNALKFTTPSGLLNWALFARYFDKTSLPPMSLK